MLVYYISLLKIFMIDVHCHLEQKDYDGNRDEIIAKCRKELKAVITSCAHPNDFDKTLKIAKDNRGFVFACYGIHPEYIKEVSEKEIEDFIEKVRKNKDDIVAIGEIGLDWKDSDVEERKAPLASTPMRQPSNWASRLSSTQGTRMRIP